MNGTGDHRNDLFEQAKSRWLKPAEVFFILQNYDSNPISHQAPQRPTSGSLFLFNRKIVPSFRKDGHNWQKKKGRNSALESHVQLTVENVKTLDCYYAHGEDNGNFQRRSYWMLNEDKKHIVLVHYRDTTQPQGERNPASASGQSYNLSQSDNFVPLENQGNGSNQSLCSLVTDQQWIEGGDNLNGSASVGTSQQDDVNLLRQAVEQFGLNYEIPGESIPFDTQKQDTDGTANSGILGNYNFARESVEGATLPEDIYFGSGDGMVSDSTVLTPTWEEIGSLLASQEAEELDFPSCLGITATSYFPDTDQLQMELEVDPSLTIVSQHKFTIREISPQWGFADEATKVIIVGSFHCDTSKMGWACMFGDTEVQIQMIQDGVICCEAPPRHSAGKVTVCITSGNQESCSEAIGFEYRDRNSACNNCIRPQQEENKSMEEVKLLARFAEMLLPNSSLQKEEFSNFSMHPTEALQTSCGTSTGIIDQVLQELLKDKLLQWLSARFMKDDGDMNCTLSKKEQGIIHIAAALGYEWALNPLVNCGVGVNFRDAKGWTALHWAAQFGRESMVVALTNSGASARAVTDPTAQEPKGMTPASIAYANGHKGLAGFLSELALTTHLSSLTLEEASCVDLEDVDVSNISTAYSVSGEDQHSVEQVLAASKSTARAAALIQAVFRVHSFRKRRQREDAKRSSVDDENGLTSHEMLLFSSASKAVLPHSHHHNVDALPIQESSRCGKQRKRFFKMPKVVKIQPQIRGFRGRKCYKVLWPVSIMEKVVLRWLRKRPGLRGYKPNREVTEEDEDILKDIRKQIVDTLFNEALRVQSMVHCPQARNQYTRMREASQQAKDKSDVFTIEEVEASLADMVFVDDDTDNALIQLPLESKADSPGYCGLWTQPVC